MNTKKGTIRWSGKYGYKNDTFERTSGSIDIGSYPSGEPVLNFPTMHDANTIVEKLLLRPLSMLDFMAGLFFVDALVERGHSPPELILPFVPGARQDRLNDEGDYLFTAKSVAREINARDFKKVTVVDPHSEVISGLIDRCHVVHAHECFSYTSQTASYLAVVSPDAGAEKRASAVAKKLGLPMVHGWKSRDVATGRITGFGLETSDIFKTLTPPTVLVVDDICDGGRTFLGLAEVLKERSIKADLYVTHGLFSQGTEALLQHYGRLFCTDSIEAPSPGVEVIKVCEKLIEGMGQ